MHASRPITTVQRATAAFLVKCAQNARIRATKWMWAQTKQKHRGGINKTNHNNIIGKSLRKCLYFGRPTSLPFPIPFSTPRKRETRNQLIQNPPRMIELAGEKEFTLVNGNESSDCVCES